MDAKKLMLPGKIVKKSNALARARWSPDSVWEARLVGWLASQINPGDSDFQTYQIRIVDLLGNEHGGKYYKEIEHAIFKAMSRVIAIKDRDTSSMYNLFSKCKIDRKNGVIELCFHPDLKEHYLELKQWVQYNLIEFLSLPSIYSQRIFEFLKSWEDRKEVTILLSALHEMLDTPKSFRVNFAEFKRKVIDKAKKDISKYTNFDFQWEALKCGRAVYEIKFTFPKKRKLATSPSPKAVTLLHDALDINSIQENAGKSNYAAFIAKFSHSKNDIIQVGRIWFELYANGNAPMAEDVPENNNLTIIDFLTGWKATHSSTKTNE